MKDSTHFQYCQKLVVLSQRLDSVLLAKRKDEADLNGLYSFIGGKMETTDESILAGMQREKNEEVGNKVELKVLPNDSYNILYRKKDGNSMILPHIPSVYVGGEIILSDEYSDYVWIALDELHSLEPKVENIEAITISAKKKVERADKTEFQLI